MGIEDQLFHWLTETLTAVYNAIGWTGVVIIMALESANIPIPSEVTMPLAGWLLDHRGVVVEVRDPDDGEAPHCDMGGLVDARALMLAAQYADGVIASEGI